MITRREFSKLGLGIAAFSASPNTIFSANNKNDGSFSDVIPPKEWTGGRRVGIRANGTYWGGGCEQIDMLSGNLNFSLPLVLSVSRGAIAKIVCSYNSQQWALSNAEEHNYGIDSGFGYGWRVQIGSIVREYSGSRVSSYT